MVRPLAERDRDELRALLARAPQQNLYMLGNLSSLGVDHEHCQFWGDFASGQGGEGPLVAVLNRYMSGWTVYGESSANWTGLGRIVDEHAITATRLQDNPGGTESFLPYLQRYAAAKISDEELMNLVPADFQAAGRPAGVVLRRAELADLPRLVAFYAEAGDMARTAAAVERPLRDLRIWLAEEGASIVAAALTNAETNDLAMIGGVYTVPSHRGRGLSKAVCSLLCAELIAEDKQPVLYWQTPAAGAVYRQLGFRPVGRWRSVWLKPSGST